MAKTILLTGASGFIGSNFIKKNETFNIKSASLQKITVDSIDYNNVDTVLHFAGLVHQMHGAPEEQYFKINTELTFNFAKIAKARGVRHFVFISTAKVFGEGTKIGKPFNEKSECVPHDAYSKSKLKAEQMLETLSDEYFTVSIVRIPLVYGAGVKGNLQSLISLVRKFPIIPLGGINNKRSMVYVGTLIDMLTQIINKKCGGVFIACDNTALSTSEILKLISNAVDKKIIVLTMPSFVRSILYQFKPAIVDRLYGSFELDNTHSVKTLDYTYRHTIEHGIKEMVG